MKQLIILVLVLVAVGYFVAHGGNFADDEEHNASLRGAQDVADVRIEFLYSDEKRGWIEEAHDLFVDTHPGIQVTLERIPSVEGAHAILSGVKRPTVWNPADSMVTNYLYHLWQEKYGEPLFSREGTDQPIDLVYSPLVWLVRRGIYEQIAKLDIERPWVDIGCSGIPTMQSAGTGDATAGDATAGDATAGDAAGVSQRSPLSGLSGAGRASSPLVDEPVDTAIPAELVKFRHTAPTRSNSGLQAIYLMVYEYLNRPDEVRKGDLTEPLTQWFEQCQSRVHTFLRSTRKLSAAMLRFGKKRFDVVVTYEQVALKQLRQAKVHYKELPLIFYPRTTMSSNHPAVILQPDKLTREELQAARTWIAFLASAEMQERAVEHGLRPSHPDVSMRSHAGKPNPFIDLARFKVNIDFRSNVRTPSGAVSHHLMRMWRAVTGR